MGKGLLKLRRRKSKTELMGLSELRKFWLDLGGDPLEPAWYTFARSKELDLIKKKKEELNE